MAPCTLRTNPEALRGQALADGFVLLETIGKSSHWWRYVLQCRCCAQTYLLDFTETVDWENGKDPQRTLLIPISDDDLAGLRGASRETLATITPRLVKDFPSDRDQADIYWVEP